MFGHDFGGPYDSEIVVSLSNDDGDTWTPRVQSIPWVFNAGNHNPECQRKYQPQWREVYAVWAIYNNLAF